MKLGVSWLVVIGFLGWLGLVGLFFEWKTKGLFWKNQDEDDIDIYI